MLQHVNADDCVEGGIIVWQSFSDTDIVSNLMGWMPPPDGIAMCQDGDVVIATEGGGIHGRG